MASVVRLASSRSVLADGGGLATDLPSTSLPTVYTYTPLGTATSGFSSAASSISYTTFTSTEVTTFPGGLTSTIVFTFAAVNPQQYASTTSAEIASGTHSTTSTTTSSTTASSSPHAKTSSNMGIIIPAVVAPVAVLLIASFAAFWFYMRRRHRRDLQNQPAFIMAAKTEKLASTATSLSSENKDYGFPKETFVPSPTSSASTEKPLPSANSRDRSPRPPKSSSSTSHDYPRGNNGIPRTSNIRDDQRPNPHLPPIRTDSSPNTRHIANFTNNPSSSPNYSPHTIRSANPHLGGGSQTPHNSVVPEPRNIAGRGPPPGVGTSDHAASRNRSHSLTSPQSAVSNRSNTNMNNPYNMNSPQSYRPPTAPNSDGRGAPRDLSPSILSPPSRPTQQRSFSPVGNRAPPPAPIKAPPPPSSSTDGGFLNQPLYSPIIRDMPSKAKRPSVVVPKSQNPALSPGAHTSPLLPSPQSDNRRDPKLTAENLRIARLANTSRLGFDSPTADREANDDDDISEISAADQHDLNHDDAKSDVSSLDGFQKLEFDLDQTRVGSRAGSAMGSIPGARSGSAANSYSPVLEPASGRPWR